MVLLLTILSILAVWALLTVLVLGLLLILKPLESVRGSLEKIAMGVRAIQRETLPLGARAAALTAALNEADGAIGTAVRGLTAVHRDLDAAAPALRPRL